MNNVFVCIIASENNNKQYLVSYFCKCITFLRAFFYKRTCMLHCIHTFFEYTGNTVDETMQQQHLNQYSNIYLHRECCKSSFICCFILTAENLI